LSSIYNFVFYAKILNLKLNRIKTILILKRSENMTYEKFEIEINTLKNFCEIYCKDKHENQELKEIYLEYKSKTYTLKLDLCKPCQEVINYSFLKLQSCPHEIKPRCRKCPKPCYEKKQWKDIAKIMKYSAIKLSLGKIKSRILKIFD
jgi:hypothetical protein